MLSQLRLDAVSHWAFLIFRFKWLFVGRHALVREKLNSWESWLYAICMLFGWGGLWYYHGKTGVSRGSLMKGKRWRTSFWWKVKGEKFSLMINKRWSIFNFTVSFSLFSLILFFPSLVLLKIGLVINHQPHISAEDQSNYQNLSPL